MTLDRYSSPRDRSPPAVQSIARRYPPLNGLAPTALVPQPARDDALSRPGCRPRTGRASLANLDQRGERLHALRLVLNSAFDQCHWDAVGRALGEIRR